MYWSRNVVFLSASELVWNVREWDVKCSLKSLKKGIETPTPLCEWMIGDIERVAQCLKVGTSPMQVDQTLLSDVGTCSSKGIYMIMLHF